MTKQSTDIKNLIICVGPSASGKSHFYNNLPKKIARNAVQVNRDILRKEYQESQGLNIPPEQDRPIWDKWKWKNENTITKHQDIKFISALTDVTVKDIYWTDTNLNFDRLQSKISELIQVHERRNIKLNVKYQFFLDAEETLIKRDNARSQGVGSSVIHRQMNQLYQNLGKFFKHMTEENTKYVKGFGKEPIKHLDKLSQYLTRTSEENKTCVIVDIDGTIASMRNRKPYDWDKVYGDNVIREHEKIIESYVKDNYIDKIIFLTGRDALAYKDTLRWLNRKSALSFMDFELYSRTEGDTRKDYLVKQELFLEHIAFKYNVKAVFDDRPQVLRMWLNLGLKVYPMQNPYLDF